MSHRRESVYICKNYRYKAKGGEYFRKLFNRNSSPHIKFAHRTPQEYLYSFNDGYADAMSTAPRSAVDTNRTIPRPRIARKLRMMTQALLVRMSPNPTKQNTMVNGRSTATREGLLLPIPMRTAKTMTRRLVCHIEILRLTVGGLSRCGVMEQLRLIRWTPR